MTKSTGKVNRVFGTVGVLAAVAVARLPNAPSAHRTRWARPTVTRMVVVVQRGPCAGLGPRSCEARCVNLLEQCEVAEDGPRFDVLVDACEERCLADPWVLDRCATHEGWCAGFLPCLNGEGW